MTLRIGINGFGRIGRSIARILATAYEPDIEIGMVNDPAAVDKLAYSLRRDSIRGAFPGTVAVRPGLLVVNGRGIRVSHDARPGSIPWAAAGIDVVIEVSDQVRTAAQARAHLAGGARKVVFGAPVDDADILVVPGVNEGAYDPYRHHVISAGSAGTNAVTLLTKVLHDRFGMGSVSASVVVGTQGWSRPQDTVAGDTDNDPRPGRAAADSIVTVPPVPYAGDPVRAALPGIGEVLTSNYCVPVPVGSLAEVTGQATRSVSVDQINRAMAAAADDSLRGVLGYDGDFTVSVDARNHTTSCLFDPLGTQVTGDGGVQVRGWFDDEWGFAGRLIDLARLAGGAAPPGTREVITAANAA